MVLLPATIFFILGLCAFKASGVIAGFLWGIAAVTLLQAVTGKEK